MTESEKELFFDLCKFADVNEDRLDELLEGGATPHVLGQLFFNRMQGVAYGVLKNAGLLGKVNREFRNSLAVAHRVNIEKNQSFNYCLQYLSNVLAEQRGKYAMLKGALLCGTYPAGYRTSNDIDLLVRAKDVTAIGESLSEAGFQQGHVRNNVFIPATRKEIIESRMMRGETVPYILEVNFPGMKFLEVDINFSLDYKNGDEELLSDLLDHAKKVRVNGIDIITLSSEDFFIHLCNHLYKEATTYPWVKMKRDMTLYKYCDIYLLLNKFSEEETRTLVKRIQEMKMEKVCSCAAIWTHRLLGIKNHYFLNFAYQTISHQPEFLHCVISPSEGKLYLYDIEDVKERFFHPDRTTILREVE